MRIRASTGRVDVGEGRPRRDGHSIFDSRAPSAQPSQHPAPCLDALLAIGLLSPEDFAAFAVEDAQSIVSGGHTVFATVTIAADLSAAKTCISFKIVGPRSGVAPTN